MQQRVKNKGPITMAR